LKLCSLGGALLFAMCHWLFIVKWSKVSTFNLFCCLFDVGFGFGKGGCYVGEAKKVVGEISWNGIEWRNQEAEGSIF